MATSSKATFLFRNARPSSSGRLSSCIFTRGLVKAGRIAGFTFRAPRFSEKRVAQEDSENELRGDFRPCDGRYSNGLYASARTVTCPVHQSIPPPLRPSSHPTLLPAVTPAVVGGGETSPNCPVLQHGSVGDCCVLGWRMTRQSRRRAVRCRCAVPHDSCV